MAAKSLVIYPCSTLLIVDLSTNLANFCKGILLSFLPRSYNALVQENIDAIELVLVCLP